MKITKSEVTNYCNEMKSLIEDFDDYTKKFNSIIDSINVAWEGDDSLKYINIMKEKYIVNLQEMKNTLDDYCDYLKEVPEAYSTLDETFASKSIDV